MSAVSFGFMPIFARFAYSQGVGVTEFLFVRFLFAFLILGTLLAASGKLFLPKRMDLLALIVLGALCYFLESTFFFSALLYSPVAIVALVFYIYPAIVTFGAYVLGWERISRRLAGVIIVALIGLVLVANPFGTVIGLGVFLALASAITYTTYVLGGSQVLRRVRGEVASFYVMGAGSVSFGIAGTLTGSIHLNWDVSAWFWLLIITALCTVLAVAGFFMGLSRIGPSRASLISLIEPVTSVLLSLAIFGDKLTTSQWLGGLMILASAAFTTIYSKGLPPESALK